MRNFLTMKTLVRQMSRDIATIGVMVGLVGITVSVLLVHLTNEFKIAKTGYDLATVTTEHRELIEEHRRLKVEAAMLGRTEDVASRASKDMKLEQAPPEKIRVVVDEEPAHASLMR